MNERKILSRMPIQGALSLLMVLGVICALTWVLVEWTYNHIYVEQGHSLQLRYKGPPLPLLPGGRPAAASGQFASVDEDGNPLELGVLKEMVGPGRHFYSPLWWERTLVKDTVVSEGSVGIVASLMGNDLPPGKFLVDGDLGSTMHKGILRKVLIPGTYRVNSYAYKTEVIGKVTKNLGNQPKHIGWVEIQPGYVGVVTNLDDNPRTGAVTGIQDKVLPPGLYPINGAEQHVDVVGIGFGEQSIGVTLKTDQKGELVLDESGEPVIGDAESGISFPSNDGFNIHMDFTAIWGIMPDQAADVVRKFGNVEAVESKVVIPQIESICRNEGSKLGAVELLVGDSRQKFQEETARKFKEVLREKDITLLYGLVRHIYIPQDVRLPIQESFIADEKKLTVEQQQKTTRTNALLKEATAKVELEGARVQAETEKVVAKQMVLGQKTAEETRASTKQLVASIDKTTADFDAQATILKGQANASAKRMLEEAKSEKFQLAVDAFGSGSAFNQWVFATGLPDDIKLNLLYAGEGTLWTDLKGFTEAMLGSQMKAAPSTSKAEPPSGAVSRPAAENKRRQESGN